jgi:Dna[CI] antecedent, DciA
MERAADFLGATMRRMGHPQSPLAWLRGVWPSLVGEPFSAHTRPKYYFSGVLEVSVSGDGWEAQLESLDAPLRERINRAWGADLVRVIKFAPAPATRLRHELDNNYTPFVRSKPVGPRGASSKKSSGKNSGGSRDGGKDRP